MALLASPFPALAAFDSLACYVHIPFCRARCDYCDFFTRVGVSHDRQNAYIESLTRAVRDVFSVPGAPALRTLYVGGGTPSVLDGAARHTLLELIAFARERGAGEVTIEANPEDVTSSFLEQLADAGANRLSLGVQSLNATALATIGRHVPLADTRRGLDLVAERWTGRWTADLIIGTPGIAVDSALDDARTIIESGADHLSLYELTIEPATPLGLASRRGRFRPLSQDEHAARFARVADRLESLGLHRYEVSNFARTGSESLHNLAYWRMQPHLGIGAGAVGSLPVRLPMGAWVRATGRRSLRHWIDGHQDRFEFEQLTPLQALQERVMMNLRLREGLVADSLRTIYNCLPTDLVPETIARWIERGALLPVGDDVQTTPWGLDRADAIAVDAFAELERSAPPILTSLKAQ